MGVGLAYNEVVWFVLLTLGAMVGFLFGVLLLLARRSFAWIVPGSIALGVVLTAAWAAELDNEVGGPSAEDVFFVGVVPAVGFLLGCLPILYGRWIVRTLRRARAQLGES